MLEQYSLLRKLGTFGSVKLFNKRPRLSTVHLTIDLDLSRTLTDLDGSEDGQQVGDGVDDDDGEEEPSGHDLKINDEHTFTNPQKQPLKTGAQCNKHMHA